MVGRLVVWAFGRLGVGEFKLICFVEAGFISSKKTMQLVEKKFIR